ncbi:MAG: ABC-2 family transporter protein, partial [Chloroflexi bacterium]|nr:ABC-2 family transporter protein [Chloroflexota bacterium]
RLAPIIAGGQLDYYLALPKAPLLHVLVSRMSMSGWGDVAFGLLAFILAGGVTPISALLFATFVMSGTALFTAFNVLCGSLAFWLGNSEALSTQASAALNNFSTYPGSIFQGWAHVLTLVLVPAAFVGYMPVGVLRHFDLGSYLAVFGGAAAFVMLAAGVFQLGLRRYESGSLLTLRG